MEDSEHPGTAITNTNNVPDDTTLANNEDSDGDSLSDSEEYLLGYNPIHPDTDTDGMPDGWEYSMDLNATDPQDAQMDEDEDELPNLWEYQMGLNATDPQDASEDKDNDGLSNLQEYNYGLNAINPDFVRSRRFVPRKATPLFEEWKEGEFQLLAPHEELREIGMMIEIFGILPC